MPSYPIRVLIVEDDPFQLRVVEQQCEACGYLVSAVTSGEEVLALAAASSDPPWDLVLCDVQLKEGCFTGIDVLLRLRERYGANISVVMVSSNDQTEIVESCILEGADSYMLKPVAKNQLEMARSFVARRRRTLRPGNSQHMGDRDLSLEKIEREQRATGMGADVTAFRCWGSSDRLSSSFGGSSGRTISATGVSQEGATKLPPAPTSHSDTFDLSTELAAALSEVGLGGEAGSSQLPHIDSAITISATALLNAILPHAQQTPSGSCGSSPSSSNISTVAPSSFRSGQCVRLNRTVVSRFNPFPAVSSLLAGGMNRDPIGER